MNHFLKVIFAASVIFGTYYYMDNSLERVQDTSIKDLTYVMQGDNRNPAYKEQQEKRLDIILNSMKKGGFDIDENLLDALENNSYIHDLQWSVKEQAYRGLDEVILNFNLVDGEIKVPVKVTFFVVPKPSALNFINNPGISKLYPLLIIDISANGKTAKITDSRAYMTLVTFYSEEACKSLFKSWKRH